MDLTLKYRFNQCFFIDDGYDSVCFRQNLGDPVIYIWIEKIKEYLGQLEIGISFYFEILY